MADSIPSLRRKLDEANARIADLEAKEPEAIEVDVIREVVREVEVEVERVVYIDRPLEVHVPVYVDRPELIDTIRNLQEQLCQFTSQSDS